MKETVIYFIRHGECAGNRDKRIRGRVDFPLNENGVRQAQALAERLKSAGICSIVSSPLKRALATAEILGGALGLKPEIREGFTNISLGVWENLLQSAVMRKYPEMWRTWLACPDELHVEGAESLSEVSARSLRELEKTVAEHVGETVALVSHRALLKPMLAGAIGVERPFFWRFHLDNAAYGILSHDEKRGFTLRCLNCAGHLKKLDAAEDFDSM